MMCAENVVIAAVATAPGWLLLVRRIFRKIWR